MASITVNAKAPTPKENLDPLKLEFGRTFAPLWFSSEYKDGAWQPGAVDTMQNISMHPAAITLHYGQSIFEGLKAYKWQDGSLALFRPADNAKRFNRSAERMAMPKLDEKLFVDSIATLTAQLRDWIPGHPGSLYIRPCIIATEACIGVRTSAEYLYFVIAMPSGAYFPVTAGQSGAGAVKVYVTTDVARAAPGGTGAVKAAVNYAVTLKITGEAKAKGCSQVLFLDSQGNRKVEEMGGMNIFFIAGNKLMTPKLTDTFLAGVTRDSIVKLAPKLGYEVQESELDFDQLIDGIRKGSITEAFACGTAAVICGIKSFLIDGKDEVAFANAPGAVTSKLYEQLTGIQYGKVADPFGWVVKA